MRLLIVVLLLTLSVSAYAGVYTIKPSISDDELMSMYSTMLAQYCEYAESKWHYSSFDPNAGYWGSGIHDGGNEGTRAVANTALAYAVVLKKTNALPARLHETYLRHAIASIRYMTATHVTGKQFCTNGKQWGNAWQSALWDGMMSMAAWILWDDLDADTRAAVERVTAHEADRFLGNRPPGGEWGDTKAEENGWDLTCIAAAANMFPDAPNAGKWREKCIDYMMNTVSVAADKDDSTIVDGKPVKDWVCTANYHPDFTLENHGFFHPSYAMVSPAEVGQGAMFFAYGNRPIPQAAGHHLMDGWNLLQTIMLPHGYWAYTQGMDWALNSESHIHYLAFVAAYLKDPLALGMEKTVAQYMRGHQILHGGKFAGPASHLGFAREAITAERIGSAYLLHELLGFGGSESTIRQKTELCRVNHYEYADLTSHRTGSKFASFSWKNKIMGLVVPIGPGHEANPYFTTPITDGLVGTIVTSTRGKLETKKQEWHQTNDGFETSGTLLLCDGTLRQELTMASVGDKTVVYADRVTALKDVSVTREQGAPIGIENDEFTGNVRQLYYQSGSRQVIGLGTDGLYRIPGSWANVDGRLGVVAVSGSGLAYQDAGKYNRDGALQDTLYGSFSDTARDYKSGDLVARRIVVFFTEVSPAETAKLAKQVRIERTSDGRVLRLALPEGGEYKLAL